jgi:hypothetical protein
LFTHCVQFDNFNKNVSALLVMMLQLVTLLLSLMVVHGAAILGPLHASCKGVVWKFDEPCSKVSSAFVEAIHRLEGFEGCAAGGEKCGYSLVSSSSTNISAKHETPKSHYVDSLEIKFATADKGCVATASSSSDTW